MGAASVHEHVGHRRARRRRGTPRRRRATSAHQQREGDQDDDPEDDVEGGHAVSTSLGRVHSLADDLGRGARHHGHAIEGVGGLHRALLVGDDQQLGLVAELVDQLEEALEVHVVQRRLDLVHQVEGRRARAEDGEQEGQCGHRTLAAREQGDATDVAAHRAYLDLDARC